MGPLPPVAALSVDRAVLAAARKHRDIMMARDLQGDPGPWGLAHVLRLLMRLVRG